jgi:hypothetical protein
VIVADFRPVPPLGVDDVVPAARIDHRLALGVQWIDALSQLAAPGPWTARLETIGARPCSLAFDAHPQSRHALRWTGRLARLLAIAAAEKAASPSPTPDVDPTRFVLRAFARRGAAAAAWSAGEDPRRYVPRRLSIVPAQTGGVPAATAANSRRAWLWPGAAYPLPSNVTALRGCVRRGPTPAVAAVVPWARVVVTLPGPLPADFAAETPVGWGHVDDRGEFVAVLGVAAVPGGALLPPALALRVWVFLPPPGPPGSDADPLAALPLEVAGPDALDDALRGILPPPAYVAQAPVDVGVAPGATLVMDDAALLFP